MAEPRRTIGKGGNFRTTESGAGMTRKGVAAYRRKNPGSKLKTAVTKCDVKQVLKLIKDKKLFAVDLKVGKVKEVELLVKDGAVQDFNYVKKR